MKGPTQQTSLDFSVQSSEDGRALYFRKDLDNISQDSRNGELSFLVQGPAAKGAIHKGAMSEPVRRAHRVKIHESAETRRRLFSRMSSTDSHNMGAAPCVIAESFDLETSSQASCPDGPALDSQNPIQEEAENELHEPQESSCAEQETGHTIEQEEPKQSDKLPVEPETGTDPKKPRETQRLTDSLPQHQPVPQPRSQPEAKSTPLIPPPSPARVRRTLEAPATPRPFTPLRTKARSRSCPRKPTTSPHMVNHKPAFQWQTCRAPNYGSYSNRLKQVPNGLCLSDSTSGSSGGSTDSLEFVPSCVPAEAGPREGTLQREMRTLFDQKIREIHCKSPLFPDGESWTNCDSYLEIKIKTDTKVKWLC